MLKQLNTQNMHFSTVVNIYFVNLLFVTAIYAIGEEYIFEEEDIYRQSLPPLSHASGTTVPGTKWCGPGNTAANYNDLGTQRDTDKCCRAHDHCEQIIEPETSLHGLHNTDWFPILKCSCEQQFINCLQGVNTTVSNTLGRVYFGVRKLCFGFGNRTQNCREYQNGPFRKRCIKYAVDDGLPKIWQFYDMPFYTFLNAILMSLMFGSC